MPLELTPYEVGSLNPKTHIDGSALIKLLIFYTNEAATVLDLASTQSALNIQLDSVLAHPGGKHLIALHISALDMTFNEVNNHYVGLLIERGAGAAGKYQIRYIDPMGREMHSDIQGIIRAKLGADVIFSPHYAGRLQYADIEGAGDSRRFRKGDNDYDCGPMLVYLLVRAASGLFLPSIKDHETRIRVDISKRAGQKLREVYIEDNGKTIEASNPLRVIYNPEEIVAQVKATVAPSSTPSIVSVVELLEALSVGRAEIRSAHRLVMGDKDKTVLDLDDWAVDEDGKSEKELKDRAKEIKRGEKVVRTKYTEAIDTKDYQTQANILISFGNQCLEQAIKHEYSKNPHLKYHLFAKSASFYNAASARLKKHRRDLNWKEKETILVMEAAVNLRISFVEKIFLEGIGVLESNTKNYRAKLESIREGIFLRLETIDDPKIIGLSSDPYMAMDGLDEVRKELQNEGRKPHGAADTPFADMVLSRGRQMGAIIEGKVDTRKIHELEKREKQYEDIIKTLEIHRASNIKSIYDQSTLQMQGLFIEIVEDCAKILGTPPCKYAIIVLGSMARKEMTPYSDLEWAIIIDDLVEKTEEEQKEKGIVEDGEGWMKIIAAIIKQEKNKEC